MKRGRPKGYSPYINVPYEDLADFVGRKSLVKVCKTWLEELIKQTNEDQASWVNTMATGVRHEEKKEQPKIEYELTTFDEN